MNKYVILIVDDDPDQLKLTTGLLIGYNSEYQLLIAANGKSGYEIAVRNRPDLILMDWEMPVMNGVEAIRLLKSDERTMSIPILMVTGVHYDTEKLKEALESGAIDFINKPYNPVELTARIKAHIRQLEIGRKILEQQELIASQSREIILKEKTILEHEIETHKKHLAINSVNMIQQGELLQSVISEIKKVIPQTTPEGKSILNSLIFKLNDKSNEHLWREFEMSFEKVHSTFYTNLVASIPDISIREKRLCAFLRMNMTTKEIASITFQTQNAIDVAKHRLRKKIEAENDEGFMRFLFNL